MRFLRLLLSMFFATSAQALVIETNDWDTRTQAGWDYSSATGPALDFAPGGGCGVSPSGGGAIRGSFSPGTYSSSTSGGVSKYTIPANENYTDLYWGHWICFSSPFTFHPIGTKVHFNTTRNTSAGNVGTGRDNYVLNVNPNGTGVNVTTQLWWDNCTNPRKSGQICTTGWFPNLGTNVPIVPGKWYWIETHSRMNTIGDGFASSHDGLLEVWIDNTLVMQHSNVVFRTSAGNVWGNGPNTPILGGGSTWTLPQAQYMFFDHNVISTTRIGRPGSVLTSVPKPAAPKNLRIPNI